MAVKLNVQAFGEGRTELDEQGFFFSRLGELER
jgi:hypothetical protein